MAYFASGGEAGRYLLFRGTQIKDHKILRATAEASFLRNCLNQLLKSYMLLFEYTEMNTLKKLIRERSPPFFFSARKTLVLCLVGY